MSRFVLVLALTVLFLNLSSVTGHAGGGVVSFNKASAEQLANLEDAKIPLELAKAIVKYREANGPFNSAESLSKVPGMTNDYLEMLNPVLRDGDVVHDPNAEATLAPSKC